MSADLQRFVPYGDARRRLPQFAAVLGGTRGEELVQRSAAWFARRKTTLLSGSRLSGLLYCRSYADLQQLRYEILGVAAPAPFDDVAKARMAWGVEHEMDGVSFVLNMPCARDMHVFEAPFVQHPVQTWLGASPDGLVTWPSKLGDAHAVLEIKCCTKRDKGTGLTTPYDKVPHYYMMQLYCEMRACECDACVFACWAESGSRAWLVRFDPMLWIQMYTYMTNFLLGDTGWAAWKRETKELNAALQRAASGAESLAGHKYP